MPDEPRAGLRADAVAKVAGAATYVEDLPVPPGCLHLATVRSGVSHADLEKVDLSAALAAPGVVAAVSGADPHPVDPATPLTEYSNISFEYVAEAEQRLLATDRVRFDGELIGVVVADRADRAGAAAGAVDVTYASRPAVLSLDEALASGAPVLHESLGSNVACRDSLEWGDVEGGFAGADHVVERSYFGGNVAHHPMERSLPFLVDCSGDVKVVHAPVANPWMTARHVAAVLGVDLERVSVRVPMVGGGFGVKQATPALMVAAALSERLGRPIRHIPAASEAFRVSSRHAAEYRVRLAADREGNLLAGEATVTMDTGAYFTGAAVVLHNAIISAWGCYRWPSFRARGRAMFTNKVPSASFRATGKNQTTFGIECAVDALAAELGLDPIAFRRRNCLEPGDRITSQWRVRGRPARVEAPPLDCDMGEMLDAAERALPAGAARDGARAGEGFGSCHWPGRYARGRGVAVSFRHASQHSGPAEARVLVRAGAPLLVEHNASEVGGGAHHVIATVCAREFGVPTDAVQVPAPDTSTGLRFTGVTAQRTTVQIGMAALEACQAAQAEIVALAAAGGGGRRAWRWVPGAGLSDGEETYDWSRLGEVLPPGFACAGTGCHASPASVKDAAFGAIEGWTPGVGVAEVEVDRFTGEIRLLGYCAVAQAGTVMHEPSARGQVAGGAIMGMGIALREELRYGPGGLETDDAFTYTISRMSDVPEPLALVLLEDGKGHGPFDSRPIAQTSLPCVSPAIANAVRDATGRELTEIPMTPERVLRAVGEGAAAPPGQARPRGSA